MNSRQRQRWSLMTVLYLVIRYSGIPFAVATVLDPIGLADRCRTNVVITAMLGGELQILSSFDSTERCCKSS
ncbi:hypothetical protein EDD22DRAFT_896073, partial [Suillus occidentalis]